MTRQADFLIAPDASVRDLFDAERTRRRRLEDDALFSDDTRPDVSCLLIDEAQFLTRDQVDEVFRIAVEDGIPVMAYGIRTDFQTEAFPGSARLLEVAHSLEELKTICRCGRKALFNARKIGGDFVFSGDQVAIDAAAATVSSEHFVTYESLCGACYLDESGGVLAPR